ncbi:MAG: tetratricopeptide repeat protein [Candidatus Aureabacteria bacterium]|nr:tetratricopeptide repeat protein [Candidatus Auribacterota bacterium]
MTRKNISIFCAVFIFAIFMLHFLPFSKDKSLNNAGQKIVSTTRSLLDSNEMQVGKAAYDRKDYVAAFQNFSKAAKKGDAEAQYKLGLMYDEGHGVPKNYVEGAKWYRKAAEQGFAPAQSNLGFMYVNGQGVSQDYSATYVHGQSVSPDYVEAVKWYRKAAEQGFAEAQNNLGAMYYKGQGVPQDYTVAADWYRAAAEQGNAIAQLNLGSMYYHHLGVPKDYTEAFKWYHKAAEQGVAQAKAMLGSMYYTGQGVPQDYTEAAKWYHKAAEQGVAQAKAMLGAMYYTGQGVPQDYTEAAKWYRKAAEQGVAEAQAWARRRKWTTNDLAILCVGKTKQEIRGAFGEPDNTRWATMRRLDLSKYDPEYHDQSKMAFRWIYKNMDINNLDLGTKESVLCIWFFYREGYIATSIKTMNSSTYRDLLHVEFENGYGSGPSIF